jgi:hypothetical protein
MKILMIALMCTLGLGVTHAQGAENPKPLSFSALQAIQNKKGVRTITGVATNRSEAVLKNVIVKFILYDEQGNQIGRTTAETMDLAPGKRWRFEVPVDVPGMTSFIVSNVNAE